MAVIYLLLGVQGSGKSTWAQANAQRLAAIVLASDAVRNDLVGQGQSQKAEKGDAVFAILNKRLRTEVGAGENVILDATHARRAWRRDAIMIGRLFSARVVGVWFDVPLGVCLERNAQRAGSAWGDQAVPEQFVREVAAGFEAPAPNEFDELWRVSG
jgi:predicted kinase